MRVLCFGDSNTYGFDPRSYFAGRYPTESRWMDLPAQKTGWEVQNAGENGREIPRRPYELQQFGQILSKNSPLDMLVVMLGPTICPSMRPATWVTEKRLLSDSAELAAQYRALAEIIGVRFADAGHWNRELAFDGVHFTETGHKAFAEGIYSILTE